MQKNNPSAPHSIEVENALLGSIMLDNSALAIATEQVGVDDFFSEANRILFREMQAISGKGSPFDFVTVVETLRTKGDLEKVGGAVKLASLIDGVPVGNPAAVKEYARIVKEKSMLRQVITSSNNVTARAFEGVDGAEALAESGIRELMGILAGIGGG